MRQQRITWVSLVALAAMLPSQLGLVEPSQARDLAESGPREIHAGEAPSFAAEVGPGPVSVTVRVRGKASSSGQVLRVVATDPASQARRVSAPVHLRPWWQTVGVTTQATGSALTVGLEELGAWQPADRYLVGEVQVADAGPTIVTTSGRQLLVDGVPYLMRGMNYNPTPVGGTIGALDWSTNPAQCLSDAQLMAAAGVNTLRILYAGNPTAYDPAAYQQCMDALHAAGVGLMWLIQPPSGLQVHADNQAYVEAYWEHLRIAVTNVKDHPATLGYVIGNEISSKQPQSNGWFVQLDELARRTGQLDPNHVTSTSIHAGQFFGGAGPGGNGVGPDDVPNLDLWGFNHYGEAYGYPDELWQQIVDQDPSRPVWFSEFGTDRYRCGEIPPGLFLEVLNLVACDAGSSGEDPRPQAAWDAAQWEDIAAHASVDDPGRAVVGGTLFMWADLWWFALAFFSGTGTQATHDVSGIPCTNPVNGNRRPFACKTPDGYFNVEWLGVNHAMTVEQPGPRVTTMTYDRIAQLFTGVPGPQVGDVQIASVACAATVSWTTDVATFPRVDYGLQHEVVASNVVHSENFLADQVAEGDTLATFHQVRLEPLVPGQTHQAHVRGFDSSGRSGTALQLEFTTAAGPCGGGGEQPVNRPPSARFSHGPSQPRPTESVAFDGTESGDVDGTVVSYAWSFGDGTRAQGRLVEHTYAAIGDHEVTLTVTDDDGDSTTATRTVTVVDNQAPVAVFQVRPDPPLAGQDTTFDGSGSHDPDGDALAYRWDLGDGTALETTQGMVTHVYERAGRYEVTLTVDDGLGGADTTSLTITVRASAPAP